MWSTKTIRTYEDGPTRLRIGLARTIYIRCVYGIFGREITKYTVKYGVHIRFWPTLCIYFVACKVNTASSAQGQKVYLLCCLQCKYSLFSTGTSPHMRSNMAYTLTRFWQETLPAHTPPYIPINVWFWPTLHYRTVHTSLRPSHCGLLIGFLKPRIGVRYSTVPIHDSGKKHYLHTCHHVPPRIGVRYSTVPKHVSGKKHYLHTCHHVPLIGQSALPLFVCL